MSIIYNSYDKSFQSLLSPYREGTARQIWDCLEKYCEIKGFASIDQAYNKLRGLTYTTSGTLGLYVGAIKEAKYNLTALGQKLPSEFWVYYFLNGLRPAFATFIRQIR